MMNYTKPVIVNLDSSAGVMPLAALGGAKVVAAAAAGVAAGLARGKVEIDSTHTQSLTPRKDINN